MTAERFWGRVFRSRYFQSGIGLPERQKEMDDEEASALISSFLKETVLQLLQLIHISCHSVLLIKQCGCCCF